ncbi:MAG: SEL1-like repeat protein [Deltaproteobacteria bacterium]|nr:SEL1-like repeat protein [Deltaproteobacteria bacterium]
MDEEISKIFQEYVAKHSDETEIDFTSLLSLHPDHQQQLKKKITAYRLLVENVNQDGIAVHKDLPHGTNIGGCELIKVLGKGGMSTVYLAHQMSLDRPVAIKVLHTHITNANASFGRFSRESKNIAKLEHENILPVYEVGVENGHYFVITSHVRGVSLDKIIGLYKTKKTPPTLQEINALFTNECVATPISICEKHTDYFSFALYVIKKIAIALDYAHNKGIIHRDIKPSNIILKPSGEPVLIDFGLSRDFSEMGMTQTGDYLGTPVYSAPEQLFGRQDEVDAQSDVYSLGVTFYEMVTSNLPYKGQGVLDVVTSVKGGRQIKPSFYDPRMARPLERIILKAIHLDKNKRYASLKDFLVALEEITRDESATQPKVSRRRVRVLVVLLVIVCGLVVIWLGMRNNLWKNKIDNSENESLHERIQKEAEQGDARAQCHLGEMFHIGEEVPLDMDKAMYWYNKSAEQGYALAQYHLGTIYIYGDGLPRDSEKALYWYQKAAEHGNADAQYSLGRIHYNGEATSKDLEKATYWYQKAAEQGHAEAQYNIGWMYVMGEGTPKKLEKAVSWLHKAANQGYSDAQRAMGWVYETGEGIPKDLEKAVSWYQKAANQGDAEAQFLLGGMYEGGKGIQEDLKKSVHWYKKAAEQDHVDAQHNLAVMYYLGNGVQRNLERTVYWLQKAASQDDADAQAKLGGLYRDGEGVAKDLTKSAYWYEKAAKLGSIGAQFIIGLIHERGDGIPKDVKKATYWYQRYQQSADKRDSRVQYGYGVMYENGFGVPKDIVLAYAWYNLAAIDDGEVGEESKKNRDLLEPQLTAQERSEAQSISTNWKVGEMLRRVVK